MVDFIVKAKTKKAIPVLVLFLLERTSTANKIGLRAVGIKEVRTKINDDPFTVKWSFSGGKISSQALNNRSFITKTKKGISDFLFKNDLSINDYTLEYKL